MVMKCVVPVNKQKKMHIPSAKPSSREQRMSISRHMRWLQQIVQTEEESQML